MPSGIVAKWMNNKGIGFITPDSGGDDYLVHFSEIKNETEDGFRSLQEGEKVDYELQPDPKNPEKLVATNVTGPGGAPVEGKGKGRGKRGDRKEKEEKENKKGKGGKKGGGKGTDDEEKRIDQEDGAVCTWEEMFAKYKKAYVRENGRDALVAYWETCKVKKERGGKGSKKGGAKGQEDEEKRIDQEDGAVCTWEEMYAKYKKTYVKENGRDALVAYWENCKVKKERGGKGPKKGGAKGQEDEEKRVDKEDSEVCTWEEMYAKYKKTYVRENGRDALVAYWETCKVKKAGGGKGKKKGGAK